MSVAFWLTNTSDHLPTACVFSSLQSTKKEPVVVRCRDTRLKNLSALIRILDNHNWEDELSDQSPSKNMEKIHVTLSSAIDHCMPYRERVIKHKQI